MQSTTVNRDEYVWRTIIIFFSDRNHDYTEYTYYKG
jgi:hypothetical protein